MEATNGTFSKKKNIVESEDEDEDVAMKVSSKSCNEGTLVAGLLRRVLSRFHDGKSRPSLQDLRGMLKYPDLHIRHVFTG